MGWKFGVIRQGRDWRHVGGWGFWKRAGFGGDWLGKEEKTRI